MKFLPIIFFLLVALCSGSFVAGADVMKGLNYTIKCTAPDTAYGVYLNRRRESKCDIVYYCFRTNTSTVYENKERITVKNTSRTVTIDIFDLQLSDTGAYWCSCTALNDCKMEESGVILLVREPEVTTAFSTSPNNGGINGLMIPVVALTAGSVILLLLLVLGVWLVPKMKNIIRGTPEEEMRPSNGVYEVMSIQRRTHAKF